MLTAYFVSTRFCSENRNITAIASVDSAAGPDFIVEALSLPESVRHALRAAKFRLASAPVWNRRALSLRARLLQSPFIELPCLGDANVAAGFVVKCVVPTTRTTLKRPAATAQPSVLPAVVSVAVRLTGI